MRSSLCRGFFCRGTIVDGSGALHGFTIESGFKEVEVLWQRLSPVVPAVLTGADGELVGYSFLSKGFVERHIHFIEEILPPVVDDNVLLAGLKRGHQINHAMLRPRLLVLRIIA